MKNIYSFPISEQVKAIITAFKEKGAVIVKSKAGTGKTTAIMITAANMDTDEMLGENFIVSFNTEIMHEITKKLLKHNISNVKARTLHSFGRQLLAQKYKIKLDNFIRYKEIDKFINKNNFELHHEAELYKIKNPAYAFKAKAEKISRFARLYMNFDLKFILAKLKAHGEEFKGNAFNALVQEYLKELQEYYNSIGKKKKITIDYMDMLYIPTIMGIKYENTINNLMLDEAQDHGYLNQEVIKLLNPKSLMIVGDPKQAIMAFAGSMSNSMDFAKKNLFNGEFMELKLNKSYRSGEAIINYANNIVADFNTAVKEEAIVHRNSVETAYQVEYLNKEGRSDARRAEIQTFINDEYRKGTETMFIARTNKAVIKQFMYSCKNLTEAYIVNKNLKASLLRKNKFITSDNLDYFMEVKTREYRSGLISEKEYEEWEIMQTLILENDKTSKIKFEHYIINLFSPKGRKVRFLTAHSSKGLESDVVILDEWFQRRKGETDIQFKESQNLYYVAITRPRKRLEIMTNEDLLDYLKRQ